ncbi:MAG: class I SAM-dependent methyltransferase [Candidatus Rokuibacteriota bacterium]
MLASLEDRVLRWIRAPADVKAHPYQPRGGQTSSMLARHFGAPLFQAVRDRVVLDYGCGDGADAIALARHGAQRVIGLEIDPRPLDRARSRAGQAGVADRCTFTTHTTEMADVIVSSDTFEHVPDLGRTLRHMDQLLLPGGTVWASFGPPWYHPKGGHVFSMIPWAHLLFREAALCRWRTAFAPYPVPSFASAGLSRMSIRRFRHTVGASPFRFDAFCLIPIQRLRLLGLTRWPLVREFATAVVTCRLRRPLPPAPS